MQNITALLEKTVKLMMLENKICNWKCLQKREKCSKHFKNSMVVLSSWLIWTHFGFNFDSFLTQFYLISNSISIRFGSGLNHSFFALLFSAEFTQNSDEFTTERLKYAWLSNCAVKLFAEKVKMQKRSWKFQGQW